MNDEREDWKSRLHKTEYFLEVLENKFPYWTLPLDLELVTKEGSKCGHKIDYEELKDNLCETELIESKKYSIPSFKGDGVDDVYAFKYRITPKGINFLNNIRMKKLNKRIFLLTIAVLLFAFIQVLIMIFK